MKKTGRELNIGDAIAVWFRPEGAPMVAARPYTGTLTHLFPAGAFVATLVTRTGTSEMTIANDDWFDVMVSENRDTRVERMA